MLRKLPGIDIPAAIDANILHAAAFLEFKQHVERLAREGHELAAYTCWMHALEIRHSLFVIPTTSESELFPPLVKMPCCKSDCFKFPGWGCGAAAASSFHPMCSLWTLGPTTMSIRRRWTSFFWRPAGVLRLPRTWCPKTYMASNSVVQRATLGSWGWEPGAVSQSVDLAILRDESAGHAVWAFHGGTAVCSVGCVGRRW